MALEHANELTPPTPMSSAGQLMSPLTSTNAPDSHLQGSQPDMEVSNTSAPQGTVLSLFLFTLYTTDFNSSTHHLQMFSDDSSIVSCITDDNKEKYGALVQSIVGWCSFTSL